MPSQNFRLGEMLNKRSPNSKTWINFDGSYTTEIYQSPVHFMDYEGNLHNIDTDLSDEADLFDYDGPIEMYGQDLLLDAIERSRVDKEADKLNRENYDFQGLKVPFMSKVPRNFQRGYCIGHGGNTLHFKPVNASPSMGVLDNELKNKIHFQDVWNDSDVCLELNDKGIKETIVLKTDRSPHKFSFLVDGTLDDDLTAGTLALEPAWLEDAEGMKRDVSQTVRQVGEDTFIDLEADVTDLVYPIYIDPTVKIRPNETASKDAYVRADVTSVNGNDGYLYLSFAGGVNGAVKSFVQYDLSNIKGDISTARFFGKYSGDSQGSFFTIQIGIHEVLGSWTETGINYSNAPATGTNLATTTITQTNSATDYYWHSASLTQLVKDWINGVKTNNGLMLTKVGGDSTYSYSIYSSQAINYYERPALEITYNVSPTAPTVTAPNGGETWNSSHTVQWTGASDSVEITTANPSANIVPISTMFGQTYTVVNTGKIKSVLLMGALANIGTLTLNVKNENGAGFPGTTTYATKSLTEVGTQDGEYIRFELPTPISVTAGQKLAFEFTQTSAVNNYKKSTGNAYTGGNYFDTNGANATGDDLIVQVEELVILTTLKYHIQLSTNNGGTWKDIVALTAQGVTSYTYDFISEAETSTALIRIRAYDGVTYGDWDNSNGVFTIVHNLAPNAPTGLTPSSGYKDRAVINRLSWTHSDPNGSDPQSKFDLQWRLQGSGTWNTITQTTTNQYYDIPANTFPVGVIEWQVRTYDQAGLSGPYSSIVTFNAADKPVTPTITVPGATIPIARPTLQWSAPTQSDYWVRVLDVTGVTTIWEEKRTSSNKAVTIGIDLSNNTSYKLQVAILSTTGAIYSDFANLNISVSYTPPAIPDIVLVSGISFIELQITDKTPVNPQPVVSYHEIFKEINGEFTKIATNVQSNYKDYNTESGKALNYFIRTYGVNGTFSDTLHFSSLILLNGIWLHEVDNPNPIRFLHDGNKGSSWQTKVEYMMFAGRKKAVAEFDETEEGSISASLFIKNSNDMSALETMAKSRNTLCYRDGKGRKLFGVMASFPIKDKSVGQVVDITIYEIDYSEGI